MESSISPQRVNASMSLGRIQECMSLGGKTSWGLQAVPGEEDASAQVTWLLSSFISLLWSEWSCWAW